MPQRFETAVAYMAVLQMGAVAMPLSMLFGPEALEFRLQDSEAVVAICDDGLDRQRCRACARDCPAAARRDRRRRGGRGAGRSGRAHGAGGGSRLISAPVDTLADDPAVLIYTSGTTGNPKGALIPHRALIGNLTGFVCSQNWFGFDPAVQPWPSHGAGPSTPPVGRLARRVLVARPTGPGPAA